MKAEVRQVPVLVSNNNFIEMHVHAHREFLLAVVLARRAHLFLKIFYVLRAYKLAEKNKSVPAKSLAVHGPHAQLHVVSGKEIEHYAYFYVNDVRFPLC